MTDARDHWYLRPGIWFWAVIALGAALRFYCVIFTEGTQDVEIWERHARDVCERGLVTTMSIQAQTILRSSARLSRSCRASRMQLEFHFEFFCARRSRSSTPAPSSSVALVRRMSMVFCRRRSLLAESVVDYFLCLPRQHRLGVRVRFAALRLAIVEREVDRRCDCAGREFVDQTSDCARDSGTVLFHF